MNELDRLALLKEGEIFAITENDSWVVQHRNRCVNTRKRPSLLGEYVVERAVMGGGGVAMFNDVYPDGHHVYALHLQTGEKIDFYQSGCFSNLVKSPIKVIGHANKVWVKITPDTKDPLHVGAKGETQ